MNFKVRLGFLNYRPIIVVIVCIWLLWVSYAPLYSVLYPVRYAKSRLKPPKWKTTKLQLLNTCDFTLSHKTPTTMRPWRIFVYVHVGGERAMLSAAAKRNGVSFDPAAPSHKNLTFIHGPADLPSSLNASDLLLVLFDHPIDTNFVQLQKRAYGEQHPSCQCQKRHLRIGFEACYEKLLRSSHCTSLFNLSSTEQSIVQQWQQIHPSAQDSIISLPRERMSMVSHVVSSLLPTYFSGIIENTNVPSHRARSSDVRWSAINKMLQKHVGENDAILQFYDEFLMRNFWEAVDLAGLSTQKNRHCY